MTSTNSNIFSEYEKVLEPIIDSVIEKLSAAVVLYNSKLNYNTPFYLAVVAQEELAKLIMVPIAKEAGNLDELLTNRKKGFFNHKVKQKIISSFTFFDKPRENIENRKQQSLYSGIYEEGEMKYCRISMDECLIEIMNAVSFYQYQMKVIKEANKLFTDAFINSLLIKASCLGTIINKHMPGLKKLFKRSVDEAVKDLLKNKKKAKSKVLEYIFKNPYIMVDLIKHAFKDNYKEVLLRIQGLSFDEMVNEFGKELEKAEEIYNNK